MSKSSSGGAGRCRRDPKKESFWRELLLRQSSSGLSVRCFCEREALKETAFCFWRAEIRRRDRQANDAQVLAEPGPSFVELHAAPLVVRVDHARRETPLELLLPGDRRLLIRVGCDVDLLLRVAAVLAPAGASDQGGR